VCLKIWSMAARLDLAVMGGSLVNIKGLSYRRVRGGEIVVMAITPFREFYISVKRTLEKEPLKCY